MTKFLIYLQHDGGPPHFSRQVADCLHDRYPDRWIHRPGHRDLWTSTPLSITFGVMWSYWRTKGKRTQEIRCFSEYWTLQNKQATPLTPL